MLWEPDVPLVCCISCPTVQGHLPPIQCCRRPCSSRNRALFNFLRDLRPRPQAHCYEVHGRFGDLRAASISARLQLAALYAATGTLLPEPPSRCTGGHTAMRLLRGCWANRPLRAEDLAPMRSAARLGGHLAPALPLLVHDLEASAGELQALHDAVGVSAPAAAAAGPPSLDPDAAASYQQLLRQQKPCVREGCREGGRWGCFRGGGGGEWLANPRGLLTVGEELRVLGTTTARGVAAGEVEELPAWRRLGQYRPIEIREAFPVAEGYVAEVETGLARLVVTPRQARRQEGGIPPYPLAAAAAPTPLEAEMHAELADSWAAHHSAPGSCAGEAPTGAPGCGRDCVAKGEVNGHSEETPCMPCIPSVSLLARISMDVWAGTGWQQRRSAHTVIDCITAEISLLYACIASTLQR
jgi:hypothetical protein